MILLLNSVRQVFKYSREKKIDRHSDTSFLSIHPSLNQITQRYCKPKCYNLEPGVINEVIGEPLSTTEYSSTDIFDIYSILLLNSKNELQWQFLTIAISISVYFLRV